MTKPFGSFVFTPVVKSLQEKYGSRRQYARLEESSGTAEGLGPDEREFLSERDNFYMASIGETGWPYIQHRGGPKGFLKVIDPNTIAFADFRGNRQYITAGNLMTDNRVAVIMVDYPRQARLKILGHAELIEGEKAKEWIAKVADPDYKATIERVFVIRVEAFDWNCPQHITPRFTEEEIQDALAPAEKRMSALEQENKNLRDEIAKLRKTK
jgi:uncharacterized protein